MPYHPSIDDLVRGLQERTTNLELSREDLNKILKFAVTNLPVDDLITCTKGEFHEHTLNEIANALGTDVTTQCPVCKNMAGIDNTTLSDLDDTIAPNGVTVIWECSNGHEFSVAYKFARYDYGEE
jgi:hypothetical protein